MIKRKKTKQIQIGDVKIGGFAPVSVQSMCTTDTHDIDATVKQIKELEEVRCELVRIAILDEAAANNVAEIKKQINIPLIADIHFDHKLALKVIDNGIDALRINPGNIGKLDNVKEVATAAKLAGIPIRIGINGGSLEREFAHLPLEKAMVESALRQIKILEKMKFENIKVSLKSSDVLTMINAYKIMSKKVKYPLHLGVTEAGTMKCGLIKSACGLAPLLLKGIGDTIRVSLTANPVEEVLAGYEILRALEIRKEGVNFVSCPTCGRCKINIIPIANEIQKLTANTEKNLTVAVMGCAVNGPGEAKAADIGIACGKKHGIIFKKGEVVKTVQEEDLIKEFMKEFETLLRD
jgi:(E)-4-hydroxy-3-methylbut-2-enyl-diphosphate synthase